MLQNGADVDVLNNTGDTPLHRAVYTSREVHIFRQIQLLLALLAMLLLEWQEPQ